MMICRWGVRSDGICIGRVWVSAFAQAVDGSLAVTWHAYVLSLAIHRSISVFAQYIRWGWSRNTLHGPG